MNKYSILLQSKKNQVSTDSDILLDLPLKGNQKMLPSDDISSDVSIYDYYTSERESCNKIRLTLGINAICSNILCNPCTEIVKYEGSDNVDCLNYLSAATDSTIIKSSTFAWNSYEAIRDTQLSAHNWDYNCGIDIFNNHLLRSKVFKRVQSTTEQDDYINNISYINDFNTIDDWTRDSHKKIVNDTAYPSSDNAIYYAIQILQSIGGKNFCTVSGSTVFSNIKEGKNFRDNYLMTDSLNVQFTAKITLGGVETPIESVIKVNNILATDTATTGNYFSSDGNTYYFTYLITTTSNLEGKSLSDYTISNASTNPTSVNSTSLAYRISEVQDTAYRALHLYQRYEVYSFEKAINEKLIEDNGWIGFKNVSKMPWYGTTSLNISKPINSIAAGNMIDMYPSRDLFSFIPKYNSYRNRIEKNWDYAITYPSSSTTKDIDFINEDLDSLKILYFDEYVKDDDGRELITIYSISQHGLQEGDYVNIYNESELVYNAALVTNVENKYIFQVLRSNHILSDYWYEIKDTDGTTITFNDETYNRSASNKNIYIGKSDGNKYYVCTDTNRISFDSSSLNMSYKRLSNGSECSYYVRIFSKLPNFKNATQKIDDKALYNDKSTLISDYSNFSDDFENHINQLSFAKNIFNDKIAEIVYTDSIDISYLKDNLGRPITSIYFTAIKRNKGYKEWYGKKLYNSLSKTQKLNPLIYIDIKNSEIEYSHCFGKNSCNFRLSDEALESDYKDIRNTGIINGLSMSNINNDYDLSDEIDIEQCKNFYGDLCSYSSSEAKETIIQPIYNRFNTAQRELTSNDIAYSAFSSMSYDEIYQDETNTGFDEWNENMHHSIKYADICLPRHEGYYYLPNYGIPIKSLSADITKSDAITYPLLSIKKLTSSVVTAEFCTTENDEFTQNQKLELYDSENNVVYICIVTSFISMSRFIGTIYDINGSNASNIDLTDYTNFTLCKRDDSIPSYSYLTNDGTLRYYYREVIQNGEDTENTDISTYPFANGCFYIDKNINLYLKRQDPFGEFEISLIDNDSIIYEKSGEELTDTISDDDYVSSNNITEC